MSETPQATSAPPTFANRGKAEPEIEFADPIDLIGGMGFLDAFPGAQALDLFGKKIQVSPWTTDDYVPWLIELTDELRKRRLAAIPPEATPVEKYQIRMNIMETEMTPDDMMGQLFRPSVTKKIIIGSLVRAGVPEDEADKWYKSRPARANEMLGLLLSGLYTIDRFNQAYARIMPVVEKSKVGATFGSNRPPFDKAQGNESPPASGSSEAQGGSLIGQGSESKSDRLPDVTPAA